LTLFRVTLADRLLVGDVTEPLSRDRHENATAKSMWHTIDHLHLGAGPTRSILELFK
jgi:hypothetical protein